ncbi:MAG: hydrogenase maturation protease [Candidatus Heimdallarchaeota archaeon]|nr:hydrogenase maturation protease [Candidatus Heimdallarchaeota archaeon]
MASTLVVSLGSTVMSDDAIGHLILDELQKRENKTVDYIKLDTDIFKLRLYFKNHKRLIIIDALTGDFPVGTIFSSNLKDLNEKFTATIRSAHRIGSIEALKIMQADDTKLANAEVIFFGIIVKLIDKGLTLSPEVQIAIPKAVDFLQKMLTQT